MQCKLQVLFFISKDETGASTKEQNSTCIIKINNSNILYLREISRFLVLVGVCRSEAFNKRGDDVFIIMRNFLCSIFISSVLCKIKKKVMMRKLL